MNVAHRRPDVRTESREARLGGTAGNEILTLSTAGVLTLLLMAEGVTTLNVGGLLTPHMFIGLVLVPPVLMKLSSTGYRMVRYYARTPAYRQKGPPPLPLRVLAPVLVVATVGIFASGVALMALGHRSDVLLNLHKVSFFIWAAVFAVHFLSYLPRLLRSLRSDWGAARRREVPGSGIRATLVVGSLGSGVALALAFLPWITGWHGYEGPF